MRDMENCHRIGLYLRNAEDGPLNIIGDEGIESIEEDCCDLSQYECSLDSLIRRAQGG